MAKRRRLSPFDPGLADPVEAGVPREPAPPSRAPSAPIAAVAGEASARAAFDTLAGEMERARADGRMVEVVPLERIDQDHLVRDRLAIDEDEMRALVASLRARGQQTPVEVVRLGGGRFGLLSGWRRLQALRHLHEETGEARFAAALAFVRAPETAAEAYLAMVEENEIRAGISFYERARLASEAARIGVHASAGAAIAALYGRSSAPVRSKIASFVAVHAALGDVLRFGPAIPERLGLALAAALRGEGFRRRLRQALEAAAPGDRMAERAVLEEALRAASGKSAAAPGPARGEEVVPGLFLEARIGRGGGRAVLSGPGLDGATLEALKVWLAGRR